MKPGVSTTLCIRHELDMSTVEKVEFLFKQERSPAAPALALKTWIPENVGDVTENEGVFLINFTPAETNRFVHCAPFYCDPKITLQGGKIADTAIITLFCTETLWGEADG